MDFAEELLPAAAVPGRKRKTSEKAKGTKKVKKIKTKQAKAKKPKKSSAKKTQTNGEEKGSSTRMLKKEEREQLVKKIDKTKVICQVHQVIPETLVTHLFPKRLLYWQLIKDSTEFKSFILKAIDRFFYY